MKSKDRQYFDELETLLGTCGSCEHSIKLDQDIAVKRWKDGGFEYAPAVWCPFYGEFRPKDDRILFNGCQQYFEGADDEAD